MILPSYQSEKNPYRPICFLLQSKKSEGSILLVQQLYMQPPNLSHFNEVSKNEVYKIIKNSPTKSCLLDPVSTLLMKYCLEILLLLITKLTVYF